MGPILLVARAARFVPPADRVLLTGHNSKGCEIRGLRAFLQQIFPGSRPRMTLLFNVEVLQSPLTFG